MKIIYLITGSGGSFYCANCYRDMLYVRAIRKVPGVEARAIPLYLPPFEEKAVQNIFDRNVFFGAISMFLREKVRFLRNMPAFLDRLLDIRPLLKLAAHQAGTTSTEGYEELTISMIEGDNAFRKNEVDRLVRYLMREGKPEIIHLSNALILGIARQLKKRMDIKVVCSVLNEDDWIDEMREPFRSRAWQMIAREAVYVDTFITPSNYFRNLFISKTGLKGDNIEVVPIGYDPELKPETRIVRTPSSVGYFCRVSHQNGFDKLVDAFIELKKKNTIPGLSLKVCGGYTGIDKPFILEQVRKLKNAGLGKSVTIYPEFKGDAKQKFFNDVDVITVPVRKYDGYGLYILEANNAGIPVVQPATGAFPEIVEKTGGGIVYTPDDVTELALNLERLMSDRDLLLRLGETGQKNAGGLFSIARMSDGLSAVYNKTMRNA